jgi:hypothetical protein
VRLWDVSPRVLRKMTSADLDRLETMRAGLFSLLPEDNEWTTVLKKRKTEDKPKSQ